MSFDWITFVELARDLEQQARNGRNPEAYLRSALSRLYFGAFGHSRNYAERYLWLTPRNAAEDHGRLKAHLKNKRRKGIADRLEQLEADYVDDLSAFDLPATVANAVPLAEAVFAGLIPPKSP